MVKLNCPQAKLLKAAGRALYGQNWKNQLARDLDINPARIRAWLAEKHEIPPGVIDEIVRLLKKRRIDIDRVLSDVE